MRGREDKRVQVGKHRKEEQKEERKIGKWGSSRREEGGGRQDKGMLGKGRGGRD